MTRVICAVEQAIASLQWLGDAVALALRLYVANVFFKSGLLKLQNWSGTLYLFENEYRVPLLPPELAAWLGTAGELLLPPLLALGLATRFAALSLFLFNAVAVLSFWHVLGGNHVALMSHVYWGLMLLVTLAHGPGKLSLDRWLLRL